MNVDIETTADWFTVTVRIPPPELPCTHRHCRRNPVMCGKCNAVIGCKEAYQPRFRNADRCAQCTTLWYLGRGLENFGPRYGAAALVAFNR